MQITSFYRGACVVLGALMGVLVVGPLVGCATCSPALILGLTILGAALGGAIGYRRGQSRAFLYFLLVSVAVLSAILVSQLGA